MAKTFQLNRGVVANAVNVAGAFAGQNNVMQIISTVKLTFHKNCLIVRSTDSEAALRMVVDLGYNVDEKTEVCVDKSILSRALNVIREETISFVLSDDEKTMTIDYGSGHFDMPTFDASLFPSMSISGESKTFNMPSDVLRTVIKDGSNFVYTDSTEPRMCSIYFVVKGTTLTVYATNRVIVYKSQYELDMDYGEEISCMIPPKAFRPLIDMCNFGDVVTCSLRDRNAMFSCGNLSLCTRLVDGNYPDVEILVRIQRPEAITVDRASLLDTILRIGVASGDSNFSVFDIYKDKITVTADDIMCGKKCEESLPCSSTTEFRIGLNADFVKRALNTVKTQQVMLEVMDGKRPMGFRPVDAMFPLVLIAPMSIGQTAKKPEGEEQK